MRQFFIIYLLLIFINGCSQPKNSQTAASLKPEDSAAIGSKLSSPPISPEKSLAHLKVEQGFEAKLAAAEPMVQAPVSINFDRKGRIWAVEMQGYMPDTTGAGKRAPSGKVVILEDRNHNGIADHRKVFLDSLVLPRSIGFYGDGVLVATPPNLWFVKNNNDTPGKKILVDSTYAVGGNVEHQPNGLLRGIDNWIYSANATKKYRRVNGRWIIQHTHYRGQWGITQDHYGRLFYNNNSTNLLGDYFLPGLGAWNPNQKTVRGFDETIVPDNRVYPIHPTPGVNRGYQADVLDDSLRLVNFTAASGPAIYRDVAFGESFRGNAFVAEPAGNLVKRNILQDDAYHVSGRQAYQGKEFLASDDERFRPVQIKLGPDGALYVIDMYRGVIQDITYLTSYLRNEIAMRHLQHPLNRGRIYKIVPKGQILTHPDLSHTSTDALVRLLDDSNGWVRTTAQRLLTDRKRRDATLQLRKMIRDDSTTAVGKIHAFWTLEGLNDLRKKDIQSFFQSKIPILQQEALAAATARVNAANVNNWVAEVPTIFADSDPQNAPYVAFFVASLARYAPHQADTIMMKLALEYKNSPFVADALISGMNGRESKFLRETNAAHLDTSSVFYHHLEKIVQKIAARQKAAQKKKTIGKFAQGKRLFQTYCQACHGADGNGINSLGAPLNGSSWVTGDKKTLLSIVLYGLNGPIKIGNKVYKRPEVAGAMPGFGQNNQLSDADVAHILSYIRNAWTNEASAVDSTEVKKVRSASKGRRQPFTADELQ